MIVYTQKLAKMGQIRMALKPPVCSKPQSGSDS